MTSRASGSFTDHQSAPLDLGDRIKSHRMLTLAAGAGAAVLLAAGTYPATAAPDSTGVSTPVSAAKQILWPVGGAPAQAGAAAPSSNDNLIFHGGVIERRPKVYITYWGRAWKHGFRVGPHKRYNARTAMRYETSFFGHLGGSRWNGIQTQYCDGIASGSTTCAGQTSARHILNTQHVLAGVWVDARPVPADIVTSGLAENLSKDPVAQEAVRASHHFGYDPNATYFVFSPPGHQATAYGSVYCAYHSEVTNIGAHGLRYSFMPFTPEKGAGCGGNSVNKHNDSFGNGWFDSYSLASGHEYAEAATDPDAFPIQDGWNDASTSENGDKCAYFHAANRTFGAHHFAVQPMWSNEANHGAGGCAMARGTGPAPVPSTP